MAKTSINVRPCNISSAERYNLRSKELDYIVPNGSLLYLVNHTRGKDERIFEYRDGKQRFW